MTIHDNHMEVPSTTITYVEDLPISKLLGVDDSHIKVVFPGALPPSLPASLPVSVAPSRSPSPQAQEHVEDIAPPPPTVEQKTKSILDILECYRMNTTKGASNKWVGRPKVGAQVQEHLINQTTIRMILPAFPFKSPNKGGKVLGGLPDTAEEVALRHLHGLCARIEEIHPAGAQIHIVSDGIMYNDLLGVSDLEVWRYGQMLRKMTKDLGCYGVKFVRFGKLFGRDDMENLDEERYLRDAPSFRSELHDQNLPEGFDAASFIANDPDATLTYRGYIKFLEKDLEQSSASKPPAARKKFHEETAKSMMARGKSFAAAIAKRFPDFVRLSIHASASEATKLSVSLIPQLGACSMTPWHSTLVRGIDGSITMSHALRVPALTHDLICEDGRPTHFREKSDLFDWPGMDVTFTYMYPTGILIKSRDASTKYSLHNVHMQKVRALAEKCSPIVLRGFADTTDERTFKAKAWDAGEVAPGTFGIIQKVRDTGAVDHQVNNVINNEAMPFQFDGMFKLVKKTNPETGIEEEVSDPSRFQLFTCVTPSSPGSGHTLFASSRLFFQHLPSQYSVEQISKLKYECRNSGPRDLHMRNQNLVTAHPTTGLPCIRWHEPWPQYKTQSSSCIVNFENGSQKYKKVVNDLLYDRRVCLYFTWEQGDVLVNDNFGMLHARTVFRGQSDKQLWRIHFD